MKRLMTYSDNAKTEKDCAFFRDCAEHVANLENDLAVARANYKQAAVVTGNMMREYAELRDKCAK